MWDRDLVKRQNKSYIIINKVPTVYKSISIEMEAVVAQESLYSYSTKNIPTLVGERLADLQCRATVLVNHCIRPRNSTRHFP